MDRSDHRHTGEAASAGSAEHERELDKHASDRELDREAANPPRTSTGRMTAPKFGSATSGGGEIEPGPEQD